MIDQIFYPWNTQQENTIKECIFSDGIVVFPTETFYAIGGNALSFALHQKIYQSKGRNQNQPLLSLVNLEMMASLVTKLSKEISQVVETFWPGPLTIVFPPSKKAPKYLLGPTGGIALRYPKHPIVEELLSLVKCPLIGTSANQSGQPPFNKANEVFRQLGNHFDLLIDGGETAGSTPSTIIDVTRSPFQILRNGVLSATQIQQTLLNMGIEVNLSSSVLNRNN